MAHRHFPFVVLEIEAENLQRAGSFYSAIFGWSFSASDAQARAVEAELDGDHDTLVRVQLRAGNGLTGPGHSLCVPDLAPVLERVVAAGGQLIAGPVEVPGLGRELCVRDTEGNQVAIHEPVHARP